MNFFHTMIEKLRDLEIPERYRQLVWWQKSLVWLVSLVLLVLFMDYLVMPWYTRLGEEYQLPDVTVKQISQAQDILREEGFKPIVQDSAYDSDYAPGVVLRQNPEPFTTVKKGRRVYLVVSSGEKPIYMPDLIRESLTNAELRLKEMGLVLNHKYLEFSEAIPYPGVVIRQSVPPGDLVRAGKGINLTVSLGPPPDSQEVPRLVGKSLEQALKELEAVGIPRDSIAVRESYKPNLVPFTVIAQSVPESTPSIDVGRIELTISTDELSRRGQGGANE
ncbi:MAG: PASTA domain-containing protein [Calditrichaeota bacterium]|nr:PASTA domain-containing protein [Calditrichota bacterium]